MTFEAVGFYPDTIRMALSSWGPLKTRGRLGGVLGCWQAATVNHWSQSIYLLTEFQLAQGMLLLGRQGEQQADRRDRRLKWRTVHNMWPEHCVRGNATRQTKTRSWERSSADWDTLSVHAELSV
ncbi:unnamed protein product [Lota lota]